MAQKLMDHGHIQEHQIVSLYLMGKLQPADRAEFEDHLVDCPDCLEELELTDGLRNGLRHVAVQDESRTSIPPETGRLSEFSLRRHMAILTAAALIVAALALPLFLVRIRRVDSELEQARIDSVVWERRYTDEHQARTAAESQPHETPSEGVVPLFALNLTRSANLDDTQPANVVSIGAAAKSIVLSLDLQKDPDFQTYRATLTNASGDQIWAADGIVSPDSGALAVILSTAVVRPGKYRLHIEGNRKGQYTTVAYYSFRAVSSR